MIIIGIQISFIHSIDTLLMDRILASISKHTPKLADISQICIMSLELSCSTDSVRACAYLLWLALKIMVQR